MGRALSFGASRYDWGSGEMAKCKTFRTFKERGEWVELRFMAQAIEHGFKVSKPWGDSSAYDVGVESDSRVLRVQVTQDRAEFSTDIDHRGHRDLHSLPVETLQLLF